MSLTEATTIFLNCETIMSSLIIKKIKKNNLTYYLIPCLDYSIRDKSFIDFKKLLT